MIVMDCKHLGAWSLNPQKHSPDVSEARRLEDEDEELELRDDGAARAVVGLRPWEPGDSSPGAWLEMLERINTKYTKTGPNRSQRTVRKRGDSLKALSERYVKIVL